MGKKNRNHSSVGSPKKSKREGPGQREKQKRQASTSNAVIPAGQQTEVHGGEEYLRAEASAAKIDILGKYILIAQDTDSNTAKGEVWAIISSQSCTSINEVPMEYRAQVAGRCQRQYIKEKVIGKAARANPEKLTQPAALHWIDEWRQNVAKSMPFTLAGLTLLPNDQPVEVAWRLVSNSGIDEGFIRPVIAAGGWPIIPGSSIKGLFRRACREIAPSKVMEWCGGQTLNGDTQPGLLRFHGAWPADDNWKQQLLDVTHPQQFWQVGIPPYAHSANALVSLFQPRLNIAISSKDLNLNKKSWETIGLVISHALGKGIGGRTSAGYGVCASSTEKPILECAIQGQGPASKLLDGSPEFRPNMFRAAIRSMALRLFAGVTDKTSALHVVDRLFGSINGEEGQNVGLLAMHYVNASVSLDRFGNGRWEQPVFSTTGVLQWHLVRSLTNREDEVLLQSFLSSIHGIVMALGGFGRSWRRPDHRIFMPSYSKTPIGCYWQWGDPATLSPDLNVQSANDLSLLLRKARTLARQWLRGKTSSINASAQWREIIHPSRMLIWTRIASNSQDAKIVHWFHQEPLKRSDLAGRLENKDLDSRPTRIGRIWNRLLPIATGSLAIPSSTSIAGDQKVDLRIPAPGAATQRPMRRLPGRTSSAEGSARPGNDDQASFPIHQGQFLESVVLFPDRGVNGMFTSESKAFLERIKYDADANFMLLEWPD